MKQKEKLAWPGRAAAIRRLAIIALVLFPCTWIVSAFLVGTWDLLEDRNAESFQHLFGEFFVFAGTAAVIFLISLLPSFQRFSEWLFSRRILRRTLIGLAWLVTLIALFYGEEDWRGHRRWIQYSQTLKVQGEELDYKKFIPEPIPDSDNFAATHEVQSWFVGQTNDGTVTFPDTWTTDDFAQASVMIPDEQGKSPRHMTDLAAWQMAFDAVRAGQTNSVQKFASNKMDSESRAKAAPVVLKTLQADDKKIDELRTASSRPDCVYPVVFTLDNPWGIYLPHLKNIKGASQRLALKACAELATGQSNQALADVKLIFRLEKSLNREPFLISYLVRIAVFHIALQPIWEGLAEHRWSDAQLRELQTAIEEYNFIANIKGPLEAEHAAGILTVDLLAEGKLWFNELAGDPSNAGSKAANVFGRALPHGWYEMEKLTYCRLSHLQMDGVYDAAQMRVNPAKVKSNAEALERAFAGRNPFTTIFTRHQLLAAVMLPALGNMSMKGAMAQVAADQAVIACALERYRLANGQFPAKLDALTPDFIAKLPHDIISGQPYIYLTMQSAQFMLYSIGWNEKDDGGKVVLKGEALDPEQGDWVWQYPER